MLTKTHRLRLDSDFRVVFNNGRMLENKFFRIKFTKNQKNINRFGFVVSNKISRKATERNTIKRRLRSICRPLTGNLNNSFDIVIWSKVGSIKLKYKDFSGSLMDLIGKL